MNIAKGIEGKLVNGSANPKDFKKLKGKQIDRGNWGYAKLQQEQGYRDKNYDTEAESSTYLGELKPTTDLAKQWQGWGTCLKPSFEPIIVARKPFKGSLVDNVIKYGVGGINIDECRVAFNGDKWKNQKSGSTAKAFNLNEQQREAGTGVLAGYECKANEQGRFPANTILTYDETDFDEVCGRFPNTKGEIGRAGRKNGGNYNASSYKVGVVTDYGFKDEGSASRYFYCAKASKKDRDEGLENFDEQETKVTNQYGMPREDGSIREVPFKKNIHPTVKPTNLMQYLVRLATPKGAIILDPFMGSGSTGKAVMYENKERNKNYKFIGIELEPEYLNISKARLDFVIKK